MKTLNQLLDIIKDQYGINNLAIKTAKQLDSQSLKHIGGIVGTRAAKLTVAEIYEITKWGINNDLSRYPEIQQIK
jgi:hypothetical protein